MKDSRTTLAISYFFVFLLLILYVLPLFNIFNVSLKTNMAYMRDPVSLARSFHWENLTAAWKLGEFSNLIINSMEYTAVSTAMTLMLSVLAAFPISRGYVRWSGLLYVFFAMALYLPNALIPQFNMMRELALYNTPIGYMLLKTTGTGIVFMIFVGYFKTISKELDEAAGMDGCGYFRYLFSVLIPLIKPVLATGIVLSAIGTWNDIVGPLIYLSDKAYFPVTQGLFKFQSQYLNNWPMLASGVLIIAVPLIALYAFLQRYIVNDALAGALK